MSSLSALRGYHALEALVHRTHGSEFRGIGWSQLGHGAAQVFTIGLALVVFANLHDREQTITIALLGLAYAGLCARAVAHHLLLRRIADKLDRSFASLGREDDSTPLRAAQKARALAHDRAAWLDYGGLAVLGLICLYHLGFAILYGAALEQILELN